MGADEANTDVEDVTRAIGGYGKHNKAWIGALISGLASVASASAQIDFNMFTPNTVRDLFVSFVMGAVAGFGGVYVVPNKPCPPGKKP